jgi:exopolyphosphatase/guanosine-5'-triphosphate,3'-diphosphate pyrophosphatase
MYGAAASSRRALRRRDLDAVTPKLAAMTPAHRGALRGVAPARARQILAGAIIAEAVLDALGIERVESALGRCAKGFCCVD